MSFYKSIGFLLFLQALGCSMTLLAQGNETDSLVRVLKGEKEDSSKVLTLINLGQQVENENPDTALILFKQAGTISEKINFPVGMVKYLNNYTDVLNQEGKFDQSLELSKKAAAVSQQHNLRRSYYGSLFNIGNIYIFKGDNLSSLQYYFDALPYFEQSKDSAVMALIYSCICNAYRGLGVLDKSEDYGRMAVQHAKEKSRKAAALNNLGEVLSLKKHYNEALSNFRQANALGTSLGDHNIVGATLINMGDIFNHQRKNRDALNAYQKASSLFKQTNNVHGFAAAHKGLGYTYLLTNAMGKARDEYRTAMDMAIKHDFWEMQKDMYGEMAFVEAGLAHTELGIRYDSLGAVISDSLFNRTVVKNTQELQAKYESEKKQSQIEQLQQDKKIQALSIKQKSTLIFILIGSIAILLLLGFLLYRIYHQRQQLQSQKIIGLEKDKQLLTVDAMLKGQEEERSRLAKDLHDGLGGMLTGVKLSLYTMKDNLIITKENAASFERSLDMLDGSIAELRRVAHNMMPEALINLGLDKALMDYCHSIQQSGLVIITYQSFGMEQRMEPSAEVIIYRIIQELLNNALKHASASKILVQLVREEERLHITVEDDGIGFELSEMVGKKGAGWANIRSRVDYLKGNLDLKSIIGKGTWVNIEFKF